MARQKDLYHTSPNAIEKPGEGRFGKGVFFASEPYTMTASENPSTYHLNMDEDELIDASSFFYREDSNKLESLVKKIMKKFGVDEETAQALLSGHKDVYDLADEIPDFSYEDAAEHSWDLQKMAGEAAEILGYKGVNLKDEQGTSSLINIHKVFDKMRKLT